MRPAAILPVVPLAAYAVAFGAAAFGRSVPAFDDHPGQLYRLWHALSEGPAPWAWNAGWWTGYPELQFYPPGFFHAGVVLARGTLGLLPIEAIYVTLVWLAWLLPGAAAYVALARLLGNGWLALPGAFVVLALSGGTASGVEGGVRVGMLPARLAWGLLPLLLLVLASRADQDRFGPRAMAPVAGLLAAIVVTHPAHAPGAVLLVLLAGWLAPGPGRRRLAAVALPVVAAAALTAFWTAPLLVHLEHTRALAWGALELPLRRPLLLGLVLAAAAAPLAARRWRAGRGVALAAAWPWAAAAAVAADALLLEPLGIRWLPADRIADAAWMAIVLAAGVVTGRLLAAVAARTRLALPAAAALAVGAIAVASVPGGALALWPRAADWPSLDVVARGLRLDDLWSALRRAPEGRVLFVRSAVPLVFGAEWWRPHTHVVALAPVRAGRHIVNGTFTHPSPVAALVYRGSTAPGAVTTLVERLDGQSLFGVALERLDAATLDAHAARLGVSAVVVLDEDAPRALALADSATFPHRSVAGPFVVHARRAPVALPQRVGADRWRFHVEGGGEAWVSARVAYYPLWRAERAGTSLPTRRGPAWDLEVRTGGAAGPVDLVYRPGAVEVAATAASAIALVAWVGWWIGGAGRVRR